MNKVKFNPQLSPKEILKLGVFGGYYFEGIHNEYPKDWFKMPNLVIQDMMLILIVLKLFLVYHERNGQKEAGLLKRILLVGFSGIVDIQWEEEYQI